MKTDKEWAADYWSRSQVDKAFMRFIREVQADAILSCAETVEQVSHCWEPAQILRANAEKIFKTPKQHMVWCLSNDYHGSKSCNCGAAHGSGVPDGYKLLSPSDEICVGDIVADCEGKWRGPVEYNWPGCGCLVSDYTTSKSGIGLPAVRGVARKHLPNRAN